MNILDHVTPTQLKQALRLVWSSNRGWSLASIGLLVIGAGLSLGSLGLLKLIIDAVVVGVSLARPSDAFFEIAILVMLTALVTSLSSIISSADTAVGEIQSDLIRDHMHSLIHKKAIEVDFEYYENTEYFNALHRIQVNAPDRAANILTSLLQIGRSGFILLAIAGMLIYFHWWIVIILLLGDLPGALARVHSAWMQYKWEQQSTPRSRRASYFSLLLSSRYPAQEVRLFNLGSLFTERFRSIRSELRSEHRQLIGRRVRIDSVAQITGAIAMMVIFAFIANETLHGEITLGDLAMYLAATQKGRGNLREFLFGIASFYQSSLFLDEFSGFLSLEEKIKDPLNPISVPRPMIKGVMVEGVSFSYPGSNRTALNNVNFEAKPGERIAIVGRNGSGKTTLVKLLCRLYEPSCGKLLIDGVPLSSFSKQDWFKEISVFLQEHGKYYLSARENIWFGNQDLSDSEEKIIAAAKKSGAHSVIQGLRKKYDSVLGTVIEQGTELSLGEWQKIALARTYLRHAQIVILDEPTSAMDALSEQIALKDIWTNSGETISILISHRLSTVRQADRIYVLVKGSVVESGNHEELIRLNGTYRKLFDAQSKGYQ